MANANRASMREGPLAALFRRTEEGAEANAPAPAAPEPQAPPAARSPCTPARAACLTPRSARPPRP